MVTRTEQIGLIRRCWALASSPNKYEASLARQKAQELMRKFGVTEAEVRPPRPALWKCPGCPNCQPAGFRQRTVWVFAGWDVSYPGSNTTTSNSTSNWYA